MLPAREDGGSGGVVGSIRAVDHPALTFLGATGTVTGSRFLIETHGARVLVDCGLFQGLKKLRLRNWERFPVDPSTLDAILVTHAHLDHVGYLPVLCRDGFRGPVLATGSTRDLAAIVLPDSGHLQEEEAAFANRAGFSKHRPALPLYTEDDARRAVGRFSAVGFDRTVEVARGVTATFRPAGHILGSSTVTIELEGRTITFSGDLGRPEHPLLCPPAPLDRPGTVVVESTYGNRLHDEARARDVLRDALNRTLRRGGTAIIPAFAVDRTEVVLQLLAGMRAEGSIPEVPIYVDSPMALSALRVYEHAIRDGLPDVRPGLPPEPFDAGNVVEVRDVEDSKAIDRSAFPSIVVSASGMATGGRVLHHLARRLPDPRNAVILVGFQAEGTRGRRLASGERAVKMLGRYVPVRAEVVDATGLSVHADRDELVDWLATASEPPEAVYVVHGEPAASQALVEHIADRLDLPAVAPSFGERVTIV